MKNKTTIRHKLKCGNVIEITIFDNDPSHQTACILVNSVLNKKMNQQSIYKIEPLDQAGLMLEWRNVKYGKV